MVSISNDDSTTMAILGPAGPIRASPWPAFNAQNHWSNEKQASSHLSMGDVASRLSDPDEPIELDLEAESENVSSPSPDDTIRIS